MRIYIEAVGLYGAGLPNWRQSLPILCGDAPHVCEPAAKYKPALLPPNERRRATNSVRIAFGACEDAVGDRLEEASKLAAVFASSGGDYAIHDQICRALLQEDIAVSPTHFHNSVHNAAAGYWSIASGSRAPSVSLSGYDHSAAAGFLEAFPLVVADKQQVLLVCSDCEVVPPIHGKRPIDWPFACALWLSPVRSDSTLASLDLDLLETQARPSTCSSQSLEKLRLNNPAAALLPVL